MKFRFQFLVVTITVAAIIISSTAAYVILFDGSMVANAQQSQSIRSQSEAGQDNDGRFQSTNDSFSVIVPQGWSIRDSNNTGVSLLEEVMRGYGVLAQLCPENQQQQVLSNFTNGGKENCLDPQKGVIHIIRYPNVGARFGVASADSNATDALTSDDVFDYQLGKLEQVGYKDFNIVNSTDSEISIDTSLFGTNSEDDEISELRVPAKLLGLTYSTNSAPNETRSGYLMLAATMATPRNLGAITGYGIFYEGNATANASSSLSSSSSSSFVDEPSTTSSGNSARSTPPPTPPEVWQIFNSFELMAGKETIQELEAALAAQTQQPEEPSNLMSIEITSNATEGVVAPSAIEFEADVTGGTEPYTIVWDFDDDSEDGDNDNDDETVVHTFEGAGTYNVTITATDAGNQSASESTEITVEEPTDEGEVNDETTGTTEGTTDEDNNGPSTGNADAQQEEEVSNAARIVRIVQGASELTDDAFSPNPIEVAVGDTVTWINDDSTAHTVTSGTSESGPTGMFGGSEESPELLEANGGSQSFTFEEAGEFPYYCIPHPNMVGEVIVTEEE
jgi:plastocyanin